MNKTGCRSPARSILQIVVAPTGRHKGPRPCDRGGAWPSGTRPAYVLARPAIPGIGIMGATAIPATVTDPSLFRYASRATAARTWSIRYLAIPQPGCSAAPT